jgi:hypothetical protein
MWRTVHLFIVCAVTLSTALAVHAADKKIPGYYSWIENELLPVTRESFDRNDFDPICRYRCFEYETLANAKPPRPYAAIELYSEAQISTKLQLSTKSLLAPTQAFFGKDGKNGFRSELATDGWDDQEKQELSPLDEQSECIEFAFPQSKQFHRRGDSQRGNFAFGGITLLR